MAMRKIQYLFMAAVLCLSVSQLSVSAATEDGAKTKKAKAVPTNLTLTQDPSTSTTVKQGDDATVAVKTEPGAKGDIEVKLKSGKSQNQALKPQKAGADGMLKWTWKIAKNTTPGQAKWTVNAKLKNASGKLDGTFEITGVEPEKAAAPGKGAAKSEGKSKKGK